MTCVRLVVPQMSGPNMMWYGLSPPKFFWSVVEGSSLMYPPPQSMRWGKRTWYCTTSSLPLLEKVRELGGGGVEAGVLARLQTLVGLSVAVEVAGRVHFHVSSGAVALLPVADHPAALVVGAELLFEVSLSSCVRHEDEQQQEEDTAQHDGERQRRKDGGAVGRDWRTRRSGKAAASVCTHGEG